MQNKKYLIIGGSTKCGTTSVFNYFEFHPEICACRMKESRYFWTNEYKLDGTASRPKECQSFDELFDSCKEKSVRLEATPDYLYSSATAKKINESLSDCKLVFILRNPIDRLISWYKFARLNGLIESSLTFEAYVNLQLGSTDSSKPQHMRSLEQGKYSEYINTYIEIFGRDNIHISLYENLANDAISFCSEISRFVGIDKSYFETYPFKIYNQSVAKKSVGAHKLFRKFKRSIRPAIRLLNDSLRKRLKLAGYNIEQAYTSINKEGSDQVLDINSELLQMLIRYYEADVVRLKKIADKNFEWTNFK